MSAQGAAFVPTTAIAELRGVLRRPERKGPEDPDYHPHLGPFVRVIALATRRMTGGALGVVIALPPRVSSR